MPINSTQHELYNASKASVNLSGLITRSTTSTSINIKASIGDNVTISDQGQAVYLQNSAAERHASMSKYDLRNLYNNAQNDIVKFSNRLAGSAPTDLEPYLPDTENPVRQEMGAKALAFAVARSRIPLPGWIATH